MMTHAEPKEPHSPISFLSLLDRLVFYGIAGLPWFLARPHQGDELDAQAPRAPHGQGGHCQP